MKLAVFDLDHTLVAMDTNEAWLRWLAANSGLRVEPFYADMVRFGREYDEGRLDIDEFMAYQLGILAKFRRPFLDKVLASFVKGLDGSVSARAFRGTREAPPGCGRRSCSLHGDLQLREQSRGGVVRH